MTSPIRIFFILPIVFFALIALIQLLVGSFMSFVLWLFVALVVFLVCWPIVIKATMKYVPVYQIFSLFIAFTIMLVIFSFYDIDQYTTLTKDKVMILSGLAGVSLAFLILFIHGQRGE